VLNDIGVSSRGLENLSSNFNRLIDPVFIVNQTLETIVKLLKSKKL